MIMIWVVNAIIAVVATIVITKYTPFCFSYSNIGRLDRMIPKVLRNFEVVFIAILIWLVLMYYSSILFEEIGW